jgi:glycosyltransferase involved in cell wall biosynthesis
VSAPLLSVVVPTYQRAALLRGCLESLVGQRPPEGGGTGWYEVVVVDDGSTDATAATCAAMAARLPLRHQWIQHAGSSAAKNLGLFLATAPIVLFFDDDDVAAPDLLREHVEAHRDQSGDHVAILGRTDLAGGAAQSPLMRYVTEVDGLLFSYGGLSDGQRLGFAHFWAGRISIKRLRLAERGLFRTGLEPLEDIDVGVRLARAGLSVIYRADARQWTVRAYTLDGFIDRCARQGRADRLLAHSYPNDPGVQRYCSLDDAARRARAARPAFGAKIAELRRLDAIAAASTDGVVSPGLREALQAGYGWCFRAARSLAAAGDGDEVDSPSAASRAASPRPRRAPPAGAAAW